MKPEPAVWIVSDTHFGHDNIQKYSGRPHDHDELMVAAWKRLVKSKDVIWHLGDLMLPKWQHKEWWQHRVAALPGIKHLVMGNHDHRMTVTKFQQMGFEVHKKPVWFGWEEKVVVMSHGPYQGSDFFEINLHGHTHNNPFPAVMAGWPHEKLRKYRNLSVENTNYSPVLLEDALERKVGLGPHDLGFWDMTQDPERG